MGSRSRTGCCRSAACFGRRSCPYPLVSARLQRMKVNRRDDERVTGARGGRVAERVGCLVEVEPVFDGAARAEAGPARRDGRRGGGRHAGVVDRVGQWSTTEWWWSIAVGGKRGWRALARKGAGDWWSWSRSGVGVVVDASSVSGWVSWWMSRRWVRWRSGRDGEGGQEGRLWCWNDPQPVPGGGVDRCELDG